MRAAHLLVVVTVAAACIGAVGCDADEQPTTLPDVTSTASSSAASPTTQPTPTPMTTAELEASVKEFFEDYIDTANRSWTSKKALKKRRTMFANSCTECLAGYRFAKLAHNQDLSVSGDDASLLDLEVTAAGNDEVRFVTTEDSPAGELRNQDGETVQKFDEYRNVQTIYKVIRGEDGRWVLVHSELV